MKKTVTLWKVLGATFLSVSALSVCAAAVSHTLRKPSEQTNASVGNYTTNVSTYYSTTNANVSGKVLLGQLHDKITSTHQTYTTYHDNGKNLYQQNTDQYYNGTTAINGKLRDFYSGVAWPNAWDANSGSTTGGYNREHVWPQSLSNNLWDSVSGDDKCGGTDMHHVRPTENRINESRSSYPFGTVSNRDSYKKYSQLGTQSTYALGGYCNNSVFEPIDSVKGDVARILMYVYTHYNSYTVIGTSYASTNGSGSSSYFATSELKITKTVSGTEAQAWALLLSWNASDPVDYMEQRRNEQVAIYQGNRNPFIDYPDLAECIWGTSGATWNWSTRSKSGSPSSPTLSINPTQLSLTENGSTGTITAEIANGSGDVSWSSNNTSVATVSSSGTNKTTCTVTPKAAGSATITASYSTATSVTCAVTVSSQSSGTSGLANSITAGDTVVLVSNDAGMELSSISTTSTKYGVGTSYSTSPAATMTLTVEDGSTSGTYSFKNGSNYLYWYSGNSLNVNGTKSNNSSWNVSFDADKNATITNVADSSRQILWNTGTPRFACYSGQTIGTSYYNVQLYKVSQQSSKTLSSISVSNQTTAFEVGDTFSFGGTVTATYSDNSSSDVTLSASFTGYDMNTAGNQTVTVSYTYNGTTKTTSYSITVAEPVEPVVDEGIYETYTMTIDSKSTGNNNVHWTSNSQSSLTYNGVTWSTSTTGNPAMQEQTSYAQIGTKKNPATSVVLSTTAFSNKTIVSASLTGYCSTAVGPSLTITADTTTMLSATNLVLGTSSTYETTTNNVKLGSNKALTFTITSNVGAAINISAIEVKYLDPSVWGSKFISSVTCDGGTTAPSTSKWAEMKTAYETLSSSNQTTIKNTAGNQSGNDLQKAIARYVFIVNKYTNRTNYPDYLSKASNSNRINPIQVSGGANTLVIIATVSGLIGLTFLGLWLKKRKEQ